MGFLLKDLIHQITNTELPVILTWMRSFDVVGVFGALIRAISFFLVSHFDAFYMLVYMPVSFGFDFRVYSMIVVT